jgi:hypothetical protein
VRTQSLTLRAAGCTVEHHSSVRVGGFYGADLFALSRSREPEAARHATSSAPFSDKRLRGCRTTRCRVRQQPAAGLVPDQISSLTLASNRNLWR